jgi:hypothetical protein
MVLEEKDPPEKCGKCSKKITYPDFCLAEFQLFHGGLPNLDELHPEPTGRFWCTDCAKGKLI